MTNYLKTSLAAPELGLSQGHLKRQMEGKGGPLKQGEHFVLGPTPNSPIQWDVEACRAAFHRLGMLRRMADKELQSAGISNLAERQPARGL